MRVAYPNYIRDMAKHIDDAVISGTFFQKARGRNTHMEKHDKSCIDILDRVLSDNGRRDRISRDSKAEKKAVNSGFYSMEQAQETIEECILAKSLDIAQWLDDAKENEKQAFEVKLPPEDGYDPVGYGFAVDVKNNGINEYSTNNVIVVLQKDGYCPLGFGLVTAYPDVMHDADRHPTGRDLTDMVRQTNTFRQASQTAKAYMLYQTGTNKPYLATFKAGYDGNIADDVMTIHIPKKVNGAEYKHMMRIKEGSMEFSTSKLMDVHVTQFNGREKIIYPNEDLSRYEKKGCQIKEAKRFVKIETPFIRDYKKDGHKKSVDLYDAEARKALICMLPELESVVHEVYHNARPPVKTVESPVLNEALLSVSEDHEVCMSF